MKKKFFAIILISLIPIQFLLGQVNADEYVEKCNTEFKRLSVQLPEEKRLLWEDKSKSVTAEYIRIGDKVNESKSAYEVLNALDVYAFQYLKEIHNFLIPEKTNLVNSVGSELLEIEIGNRLLTRVDSIEKIFNEYANSNYAENFQNSFSRFLIIKNQIIEARGEDVILFYTVYEPKDNAYASPDFIKEFKVYDWEKKIKKLKELNKQLDELEISIQTNKFGIIKDPIPIIPIMLQISTLLVLISSLLVNFGFKLKGSKIILILVIASLTTSFLLLFLSSNTIINSLINVFVPGIMYIIYYQKNKTTIIDKNASA